MCGVDDTQAAWERVAAAVMARRSDLGLTQQAAAELALTSDQTWSLIERAARTSYRSSTLRGVARALGWPVDALPRILDGEDPAAIGDVDPDPEPTPPGGLAQRRVWDSDNLDNDPPPDWPLKVGQLLAELREARGLTPDSITGVSRASVEKLEAGIRRGVPPAVIDAYLAALEVIPEAIDFLGAGAPLEAVMLEHQEPAVQIAALTGRLDPDAQREAVELVREIAERRRREP